MIGGTSDSSGITPELRPSAFGGTAGDGKAAGDGC